MIANTLAEEWLEHAHNANQVHKLGNQLGYDLALCGYCDKVVEYELGEGEGKLAGQWRNPTMDERRLVPELT